MAKPPKNDHQTAAPEEFAEAAPRELYPVADIRFVMVEIGKLTTKVDRLISDAGTHGDKIDEVRHQVTFVKGALYVVGVVLAVMAVILGWYFSGKFSVTFTPGK